MKKSVYDHFDDYDDTFYNQLVSHDFNLTGLVERLPKGFSFMKKVYKFHIIFSLEILCGSMFNHFL